MNTTQLEAQAGVQSNSPQELTETVKTALYSTPTMTFGEVGKTGEQTMPGYEAKAHSVGHFESTRLLTRQVELGKFPWLTTDLGNTQLFEIDVLKALREAPQNSGILAEFQYYRANIEVTLKLNTNQFYFGMLQATLFPTLWIGNFVYERSVLDPTLITASMADSVIKTWEYSYPFAWLQTRDSDVFIADEFPVYLSVDVLAPLNRAKDNMPDTVEVQVWGRFTDIQLAFPMTDALEKEKEPIKAQSARGHVTIQTPTKGNATHPAEDPATVGSGVVAAVSNPVSALIAQPISDVEQAVDAVSDVVTDAWGGVTALLPFLDKPDRSEPQTPIVIEEATDMYNTDLPDSNVSISLYKQRYADPGAGRMPMSKNWTISEYARIPGLRTVLAFVAESDDFEIPLIMAHKDNAVNRIPLDFAALSSTLWRGSIKMCLMFVTSAFNSARFAVQYINATDTIGAYPNTYDRGITKVVNVKGDTHDLVTLPWLDQKWWDYTSNDTGGAAGPERVFPPRIRVSMLTPIISTDVTLSPKIYMLVWIAGGDDIQFAYPRVPQYYEWTYFDAPEVRRRRRQNIEPIKAQTSVGKLFQGTFPPIAENVFYDIDNGYCHHEQIGPITDVMKRYSPLFVGPGQAGLWKGSYLDLVLETLAPGADFDAFRAMKQSLFGSWRSAFLYRSGGYRYRQYVPGTGDRTQFTVQDLNGNPVTTVYVEPFDRVCRLTIPQTMFYPFAYLGMGEETSFIDSGMLGFVRSKLPDNLGNRAFIAARDDIQIGFPILPQGIPQAEPLIEGSQSEKRRSLTLTRGK
jgi:hypothetical protein